MMIRTFAAEGLLWQEWEGVYIVYQPSSTETHVFNETTATVLRCLKNGPATMGELAAFTVASLGIEQEQLESCDLGFVVDRLEELGLIEWPVEAKSNR